MIEALCRHLKNYFLVPNGVHIGNYVIEGGSIELPFLQEGQYYRVVGSVFNDGVHKRGQEVLADEVFYGAIWAMAVPKEIQALAQDIEAWENENGKTSVSPYQSESFGGYSYSKATDSASGGAITWQTAFRKRLNPWRKV